MLKLTQDDVKKIESFMINKTRDLELALYNCLIDGDDNLMVSYALSMYQNGDGGFGHGLEPDNTCPSSSTIATEYALSLLRRIRKKQMAIICIQYHLMSINIHMLHGGPIP